MPSHRTSTICLELLEGRILASAAAAGALVENLTLPTLCAEEDNVNVPLSVPRGRKQVSFVIEARHPRYPIGDVDHRDADFTNCPPGMGTGQPQTIIPLFDDHRSTALVAVHDPNFHRPGMRVRVGGQTASGVHFFRIIRRIEGTSSWPEVLVLYSDGNLRLKPQAMEDGPDPVFGSSVIVGPAAKSDRPIADIKAATYIPKTDTIKIAYRGGGSARIRLAQVNRRVTRVEVTGSYATTPQLPFATLRSMFVSDGNADVDQVTWKDRAGAIHAEPITSFQGTSASAFTFSRKIWSAHNTSAPDIVIQKIKEMPW